MSFIDCLRYCQTHEGVPLSYIHLNNTRGNNVLACEECYSLSSINAACCPDQHFLSTIELMTCAEDHVFENWPPINPYLLKKIREALIENLDNFKIEEYDEDSFQAYQKTKLALRDEYNLLSQKFQIRGILQNNTLNVNQKNEQLLLIISQVKRYTKEIEDTLDLLRVWHNNSKEQIEELKFQKAKLDELEKRIELDLEYVRITTQEEIIAKNDNTIHLEIAGSDFYEDTEIRQYISSRATISSLTINLYSSSIEENEAEGLLKWVGTLKDIRVMDFQLSEGDYEALLNITKYFFHLNSLSNLTQISFNFNQFPLDDNLAREFAEILKEQQSLEWISLLVQETCIQSKGPKYLVQPLQHLKNLSRLSLNFTSSSLSEPGIQNLAESLEMLVQLRKLDLNIINTGYKKGLKQLLKSIARLENLVSLDLTLWLTDTYEEVIEEENQLTDTLERCKSLRVLTLNFSESHYTRVESLKSFSSMVACIQQLTHVSLIYEDSDICNSMMVIWMGSIANLKNLTSLELNFKATPIDDEGARDLGEILARMSNLTSLKVQLSFINVTKKGRIDLIQQISRLSMLIKLDLRSQEFENCDAEEQKQILISLSHLLDLTSLNFVGECKPNLLARHLKRLVIYSKHSPYD